MTMTSVDLDATDSVGVHRPCETDDMRLWATSTSKTVVKDIEYCAMVVAILCDPITLGSLRIFFRSLTGMPTFSLIRAFSWATF